MIKTGMTIAQAIQQLTKGFIKTMGRQPDGLEKIKINMEARERVKDLNKVVDMQGNVLDTSKPIMGGTQEKSTGMFDNIFNRIQKENLGKGPKIISKKDEGIMKVKPGNINYDKMSEFLGVKLRGDETFDELLEIEKNLNKPKKADGGRIGYKDGPDQPGRRKFMKIIGGLATIPLVGKYFKQADKVAPAAEKAAEVITQAPSYFFDMITKIKMFGKIKPSASYGPRQEVHVYSAKNGDEYELVEDLATGDQIITKDKMGIGSAGGKTFDTINDRTIFQNKKGIGDEATKGTPPDEYEEMKVIFDNDGTMGDVDNIDEIVRKEIIEEASEVTPPIKKASGGLAYMLGE
jgi:hypothetical protein